MNPRTTGAEMRRTVRRLTAGVAGSAVVAAAVVTGALIYNDDQPATAADTAKVTAPSPDGTTPSVDDGVVQDENGAAAPVAPVQPPTVARGGGHASSGGS